MYNDNIIYLSRLFWYFQVLGHFWARIMSMHHFSRFLSSPRLLPELLEVAKWGSKPVSCFFSLVGTHTSLNVMWTLSWKWFSTHYILKMDYCTLLLICSKMCQLCKLEMSIIHPSYIYSLTLMSQIHIHCYNVISSIWGVS